MGQFEIYRSMAEAQVARHEAGAGVNGHAETANQGPVAPTDTSHEALQRIAFAENDIRVLTPGENAIKKLDDAIEPYFTANSELRDDHLRLAGYLLDQIAGLQNEQLAARYNRDTLKAAILASEREVLRAEDEANITHEERQAAQTSLDAKIAVSKSQFNGPVHQLTALRDEVTGQTPGGPEQANRAAQILEIADAIKALASRQADGQPTIEKLLGGIREAKQQLDNATDIDEAAQRRLELARRDLANATTEAERLTDQLDKRMRQEQRESKRIHKISRHARHERIRDRLGRRLPGREAIRVDAELPMLVDRQDGET